MNFLKKSQISLEFFSDVYYSMNKRVKPAMCIGCCLPSVGYEPEDQNGVAGTAFLLVFFRKIFSLIPDSTTINPVPVTIPKLIFPENAPAKQVYRLQSGTFL
jgi:hypothetical protein